MKKFSYVFGKYKKSVLVKPVSVFSSGLMFRKNSPPLLFTLSSEKKFSIHSLFCKPFVAIWLDEKKRVIKKVVVDKWRFKISGKGKYLLEIPIVQRELP